MKPCGLAYWLITVAQIPVAVAFTACIVQQKGKSQTRKSQVVELVHAATDHTSQSFSKNIIFVHLI